MASSVSTRLMSSSSVSCPQFLITTGDNLDYLDGVHTVFGEVTEGLDVLAKINQTFVDKDFIPLQDVRFVPASCAHVSLSAFSDQDCPRCRINHTVILEDPFDDPPDLPVPERSPEPTKEQLDVSVASQSSDVHQLQGGAGTGALRERPVSCPVS